MDPGIIVQIMRDCATRRQICCGQSWRIKTALLLFTSAELHNAKLFMYEVNRSQLSCLFLSNTYMLGVKCDEPILSKTQHESITEFCPSPRECIAFILKITPNASKKEIIVGYAYHPTHNPQYTQHSKQIKRRKEEGKKCFCQLGLIVDPNIPLSVWQVH